MDGITRRVAVKVGLTATAAAALAGATGCASATSEPTPEVEPELLLDPATRRVDWEAYAAKDPEWWSSPESVALADFMLECQQADGGWHKDMGQEGEGDWDVSTVDNGATWSQVRYLAKSYTATADQRYMDACVRGFEFLLGIQYESGGWPQIPGAEGTYHAYITFNDDATPEVARLMRDAAERSEEEGFAWLDEDLASRANDSFQSALRFILDHQVVIGDRLTAWCQQYDNETLEPADGRKFEPAAVATWESVAVVKLLQSLPSDPEIERSVDAALSWFDDIKIQGMRYVRTEDDGYLEEAGPDDYLWARFYDLEGGEPVFGDTDGQVYTDVSQVSAERRAGYDWYGTWPLEVL